MKFWFLKYLDLKRAYSRISLQKLRWCDYVEQIWAKKETNKFNPNQGMQKKSKTDSETGIYWRNILYTVLDLWVPLL